MRLDDIIHNEDEIELLIERCDPFLNENSSWMSHAMQHSLYMMMRELYPKLIQTDTYILVSLIIKLHAKRSYHLIDNQ